MLSWIIHRKLDAFEQEYSYDMSYARDMLDASVRAMLLFHKATAIRDYRQGLPKDAWYGVKLAATRTEDCGPCLQLVATMAERDGQSPEMIRAVVGRRFDELPEHVRLSVELTEAIIARNPSANALRERLVEEFGRHGLVTLALAIVSSRFYPTLKYALGYGHACSVVHVGGAPVLTPQEAH